MTSHYTNIFYFIIIHRLCIKTRILRHSFKCYGRCLMVQKPLKSLIGHLLFRIKCYFRLRILRSQVKQHMWPTKRYIELLASTLMCLDISWGISLCYKLLSKLCWSPAQIMFPEKNFLYSEIFMEAFIHCKESVWMYKFPMIQQHINIPSETFLLAWGKFFQII